MTDTLALRKEMRRRKQDFNRQDGHRHKRLARGWRKPHGLHSKIRHQSAGQAPRVKPGYGFPADVRGLHSSGLKPIIVSNVAQAAKLDPKTDGAVLAASTGMRKRIDIIAELMKRNVAVLNIKKAQDYATRAKSKVEERKKLAAERADKKTKKKTTAPKKEEKKLSEEEKKEAERKEAEKVLTQKEN